VSRTIPVWVVEVSRTIPVWVVEVSIGLGPMYCL
jgi:hypothetical protein